MNSQQVEQWLIQESKKKNTLAEAYLSLLKDATPEMRQHWFNFLGSVIGPVVQNRELIQKAANERK